MDLCQKGSIQQGSRLHSFADNGVGQKQVSWFAGGWTLETTNTLREEDHCPDSRDCKPQKEGKQESQCQERQEREEV